MAYRQSGSKTLLQRRSSLSNIVQQLLDGAAVIGIAWALIMRHMGALYSPCPVSYTHLDVYKRQIYNKYHRNL